MHQRSPFVTLALSVSLPALFLFTGCHLNATAMPPAVADDDGAVGESRPAVRLPVVSPVRKTLTRTTTQPGNVKAFEQTPLYAKIEGYLRKTRNVAGKNDEPREVAMVDIGDVVQAGDVLAELLVPEMGKQLRHKMALKEQANASIGLARAGVTRADGTFKRWQAEHTRISKLAEGGSISQKLVEETLNQLSAAQAAQQEATAELAVANAQLKVAKADVAHTKALLEYAKIRAPFKGVITQRNIDTGHFVQPPRGAGARPLFVVTRTDKVRVVVDVPELEAPLVDTGEKGDDAVVRVQALDHAEFPGKVNRASWLLDDATRTLRTEIDLDIVDGLTPGMYATVRIVLAERPDALTLPSTAVLRDQHQSYCWCVEAGKAVRKEMTVGLRVDADIEVVSGLTGKETVIRNPPTSLKEGQKVEAAKP